MAKSIKFSLQGLLPEQAHANAWKFTIAIEAALAIDNINTTIIDEEAKTAVEKIKKFVALNSSNGQLNITRTAKQLLDGIKSFNFSAYGFGVGMSKESNTGMPLTPQVIETLFESINKVCREIGLLLTFDKLDDSWDGSPESHTLLIGLLKAAKEINDGYSQKSGKRGIISQVTSFWLSIIFPNEQSLYRMDSEGHTLPIPTHRRPRESR